MNHIRDYSRKNRRRAHTMWPRWFTITMLVLTTISTISWITAAIL